MNPNQPFYRHVSLGGRAVLWLIGCVLAVVLLQLAWLVTRQLPIALGVEIASVLLLVSAAALPPSWYLIGRLRRRFRAGGLHRRVRQHQVAVALIAFGASYGVIFPTAVLVELIASSHKPPSGAIPWWICVAYLLKVGLALILAKQGFKLLAL